MKLCNRSKARTSPSLRAGDNHQCFCHGTMLDIAENRIYAHSFGMGERLLNHTRQTTTEADAEQTAMHRI